MADQTGKPDDPEKAAKAAVSRSSRATKAAGAASRARRIGGAGRSTSAGHASRRHLPPVEQDTADTGKQADAVVPEDAESVDVVDAPPARVEEADTEDLTAEDVEAEDVEADGVEAADVEAEDEATGDAEASHTEATDAGGEPPLSLRKTADRSRVDDADSPDDAVDESDDQLDDQPDDAAADSRRSARPGEGIAVRIPSWAKWAPAGLLIAGVIVMIVLILVAAHSVWYAKPSASAIRDQVLAAAKTCTARSNTYSYTTLDKDEAAAAACTTGGYTKKFTQAFNRLVKPQAVKLKASQSVQINAAGIATVGHKQWTVVVYGQTKITQSGTTPRTDPFAAEVVMARTDGKWLIENIKLPSATN